ncbi:MAG: PQQ-binding-like beta-propeller repeat protein [Nitrososphaerota archaeon]|nr:PQQ-binding-like beta-propeller repeat protein [Candidatus Bathyarchaeota archaeon]MDW8048578.1 PQQ-binding-like beta-propeller repeat protein [Nitrososphaerota archaeon]
MRAKPKTGLRKTSTLMMAFAVFSIMLSATLPIVRASASSSGTYYAWPMAGYNLQRTGYTDEAGPKTNNTLWIFDTGSVGQGIRCGVAVAYGIVLFGSDDDNIYAVNASTGTLIWKFTATGSTPDMRSTPAVADGKAYFGSRNGTLFCVDVFTGALIWKFVVPPTPGTTYIPIMRSSPAVADGMVVTGVKGRGFYCLNATTGAVIWNFTTGDEADVSPAIADGKVYFGSDDDQAYCLDLKTGALLWNRTLNSNVLRIVTYYRGLVFASVQAAPGVADGIVYALNATTGEVVRNYTLINGGNLRGGVAVAGDKLVVSGSHNGIVYCFDIETGRLIWNYSLGVVGAWYNIPAIAKDTVYIIGRDAIIHAIDLGTGQAIWKYQTDVFHATRCDEAYGAIAYGCLFIGAGDGKLYCFGAPRNDIYLEMLRYISQISQLQSNISSLLSERSTLQSQINTLQGQVSSLRNSVNQLQGQVTNLQNQVSQLQSEKASLQSQVDKLQTDKINLQNQATNNLYMGLGGGAAVGLVIGVAIPSFLRRNRSS